MPAVQPRDLMLSIRRNCGKGTNGVYLCVYVYIERGWGEKSTREAVRASLALSETFGEERERGIYNL